MSGEKFLLLGFPMDNADHVCSEGCNEEKGHIVNPVTSVELGEADSGILVGMFVFHPGQGILKYASYRASNFNDLGSGVAQSVFPRLAQQAKAEVVKRVRASPLANTEPTLAASGPEVPDAASGALVVPDAATMRNLLKGS